ncbi:hypothetical protein GQ607_012065, partial [Colletotrichum asianum]
YGTSITRRAKQSIKSSPAHYLTYRYAHKPKSHCEATKYVAMAVSSVTLLSSSLLPVSFRSVFFFVYVVVAGSTVDSVEAPILATTPLLRAKSLGCKLQRLRCALNRRSSLAILDTGQVSLDFWAKGTDNR